MAQLLCRTSRFLIFVPSELPPAMFRCALRRGLVPAVSAGALGLHQLESRHFTHCDERAVAAPTMKRTKSVLAKFKSAKSITGLTEEQKMKIANSKLMEGYKYIYGDKKVQLIEEDVEAVLLGCGILDQTIVRNMYLMCVNFSEEAKSKKVRAEEEAEKEAGNVKEASIPYTTFEEICSMLAIGTEEQKLHFIFDFIDLDGSGLIDKYEVSEIVRHLLFCHTNWYGEEILYENADDFDLFFGIETETLTQLKANRFAHDMITSCHGGSKQMALNKKQFVMWANRGGKQVEKLKQLFSILGIWPDTRAEGEDL